MGKIQCLPSGSLQSNNGINTKPPVRRADGRAQSVTGIRALMRGEPTQLVSLMKASLREALKNDMGDAKKSEPGTELRSKGKKG